MAYTIFPAIRNSISVPTMAVSDNNNKKDGFSFGNNNNNNKGFFKSQRNLQHLLTVTNVATPSPVIAPPPLTLPEGSETTAGCWHPAWTSIPQERWEGELHVQGQIPLWLVYIYVIL